jgi:hypothetical protein
MSKITVKFETTREALMALADLPEAAACPDRISGCIGSASLRCPDCAESEAEGDDGWDCRKCWAEFIDRITVSFSGTGVERTGEDE